MGLLKRIGVGVATGGLSEADRATGGHGADLVTRVGRGAGLVSPTNPLPEDKLKTLYGPTDQRAADLYQKAMDDAARNGAWTGPTPIGPGERVEAPQVTAQGVHAGQIVGRDVTAPTHGTQSTVATAAGPAAVRGYAAGTVAGPRDVNMGALDTGIHADQIGPAAQTGGVGVSGAGSIAAGANQARGEALEAARGIASAPSAAQAMFKSGLGRIANTQFGLAAQSRGPERAGARREAMLAIGNQGVQAVDQAAAQSAIEEQRKREGYFSALSNLRSGDTSVATTDANITAQRGALQAQLDAAIAQGNTAAINQIKQQQASLDLTARTGEVGAGITGAKLATDVAAGNVGRGVEVDRGNVDRAAEAGRFGAAGANAAAEAAAGRETAVNVGNTERAVGREQTELQRGVDVNTGNVGRDVAVQGQNVGNALTADTTTATQANAVGAANADRTLGAQEHNQATGTERAIAQGAQDINAQGVRQTGQAQTSAAGNAATVTGEALPNAIVGADKDQAKRQADADAALTKTVTSAVTSAASGGAGAPPAPSDERAKTDVHDISGADIARLAEAMSAKAKEFRYKPGVADGGAQEHAGFMAQDLEKSAVGRLFVSRRPDGLRQVDYGQLAALMSAEAVRENHRRRAA